MRTAIGVPVEMSRNRFKKTPAEKTLPLRQHQHQATATQSAILTVRTRRRENRARPHT